jgi:hypothetical protein|tara:strand:+ start:95 stop:250 length:156 start_codon:yes stop_codon:yes gene_type:complete
LVKESSNEYYYFSGEQNDMEEAEKAELIESTLSELINPDRELMLDYCADLC